MTQYRQLQDVAKMIGVDDARRKAFIWISGGNDGSKGGLLTGDFTTTRLPACSNRCAFRTSRPMRSKRATRARLRSARWPLRPGASRSDRAVRRRPRPADRTISITTTSSASRPTRRGIGYPRRRSPCEPAGPHGASSARYVSGLPPAPPRNSTPLARLSGGVRPVAALPLALQATCCRRSAGERRGCWWR